MSNPLVSIIIRTKNEERWITSCLKSIFNQTFQDFEIIIVDNESSDKTIEKLKEFKIKEVLKIKDYLPGKALNIGIKKSSGKYIVCLSAHCIPVNNKWLSTLIKSIEEDNNYAGVYGRQEPMTFSTLYDKRDMMLIFGLDRKIQIKDSFFHNANSIIKKSLWTEVPFDENLTNIEDRIWAKMMLKKGYKLLYEPDARVYHYHGIHQNNNDERLKNVVDIIETHHPENISGKINAENLNIIAILPIKGLAKMINGEPLLKYTIENAKNSKFIDKVIVSTDNEDTAKIAQQFGAHCPFLRPKSLSEPFVSLEIVQKYSLERIEENNFIPDLIVHLEETFPFRPKNLLDNMITKLLIEGYDSIVAAKRESGWLWQNDKEGNFRRLDSGDVPREFKENSLIGLHGLGCVTHPECIRSGQILGSKIGLYRVEDPMVDFEVRSDESIKIASKFLKNEI